MSKKTSYAKLHEKRLSAKQKRAIEMLIDFEHLKTHKEIASVIGITRKTLYNWLHDPAFLEELNRRSDEFMKASKYRVNRALLKKITEGDVQAIKLYYEKIGELAELGTLKIVVDLGGLDDSAQDQDQADST